MVSAMIPGRSPAEVRVDISKPVLDLLHAALKRGQPRVHLLDLLPGGDGVPPQQRHVLLQLGQKFCDPRIMPLLPFCGFFERVNALGKVGDLSFNVHAGAP